MKNKISNKNNIKKNYIIELFRLVGFFMVVGTHVKSISSSKTDVLLACMFADGVAIFWFITGAFLFDKKSYKQKLNKLFQRIIKPLVFYTIIYYLFYDYAMGTCTLKNSVMHPFNVIFNDLRHTFLTFNSSTHLWYLYVYILVIICYPVLKKISELIKPSNYKKTLIILLLVLIYNDVTSNTFLSLSHGGITGVIAASFFIYLGHIVYKIKDELVNNKKNTIIAIILLLVLLVIRFVININVLNLDPNNRFFFRWHTSFGFINTICLYIIISHFCRYIKKDIFIAFINKLGSLTYRGYIIHIFIMAICDNMGLRNNLIGLTEKISYSHFIYQILYTIIIFSISLLVSYIIEKIKAILINLTNRNYNKEKI